MVKYFLFTFFQVCVLYSKSSITISFKDTHANQVFSTLTSGISLNLTNYMQLKPSDIKKLTGQKLTLKQRIVFKISQRQFKKAKRKGNANGMFPKNAKEPFKWHWGGFFLGLFLPIVGLAITGFFKDDQRKNRITSAAIGTLVVCVGFLLFAGLSF